MPDKNSQFNDVRCKGRIPSTGEPCNQLIGTTDGERIYINGLALQLDPPRVKCDRCGFVTRLGKPKRLQKSRD